MLYETTLPAGGAASLDLGEVHDFALVYLGDSLVNTLDRRRNEHLVQLPARTTTCTLRVFVEAMGRVNYGPKLADWKGLSGTPIMTEAGAVSPVRRWRIYPLSLGEEAPRLQYSTYPMPSDVTASGAGSMPSGDGALPSPASALPSRTHIRPSGPVLCKTTFSIRRKADTFLDMRAFHKGIVWINGHCLGRYWNIGPTQTMYLPGAWLRTGANEIVVMDLFAPASPQLQGLDKPILDSVK
jgi:beta-galactosidase